MDEKLWDDLETKWHGLYMNGGTKLMFSAWMYYQGCLAQAEADRLAVGNALSLDIFYIARDRTTKALAAAAIKGE